ncbi:MAG: hypothetical protein AABW64_02515 [Nanoarchaeota archaeon]
MQEIVLKLEHIKMQQFDPRKLTGSLLFTYTQNGEKSTFTKLYTLDKGEVIVADIIKTLKSLGKMEVQPGDELLGSMFVIRLFDEDNLEQRLLAFFVRLCEKARMIKRIKDHTEYMQLYDQLRMQDLKI